MDVPYLRGRTMCRAVIVLYCRAVSPARGVSRGARWTRYADFLRLCLEEKPHPFFDWVPDTNPPPKTRTKKKLSFETSSRKGPSPAFSPFGSPYKKPRRMYKFFPTIELLLYRHLVLLFPTYDNVLKPSRPTTSDVIKIIRSGQSNHTTAYYEPRPWLWQSFLLVAVA